MNKYVHFKQIGMSASGKTKIINVTGLDSDVSLGQIRWHAPWRKYTFHPLGDTLYDSKCLKEIVDEMDRMTNEHKKQATKPMKFRKNEKIIVNLETFGEVVASAGDKVSVKIGKLIYDVNPDKVKRIISEQTVDLVVKER